LAVTSESDPSLPPFHLKSAVNEALPPGWKSIDGDFIWITPVYLSHIGEDMFMMPRAGLSEEIIYVYCLPGEVVSTEWRDVISFAA